MTYDTLYAYKIMHVGWYQRSTVNGFYLFEGIRENEKLSFCLFKKKKYILKNCRLTKS